MVYVTEMSVVVSPVTDVKIIVLLLLLPILRFQVSYSTQITTLGSLQMMLLTGSTVLIEANHNWQLWDYSRFSWNNIHYSLSSS